MNHIDRLLQRALARPRDAVKPLFDPFERTAPLPLDAAAPLHVARAAEHPGIAAATVAAPVVPREATPTLAAPTLAAGSPAASSALPTPAERADAPALPPPAPALLASTPRAAGSPLARADAFMRSLGARLPDVLPPVDDTPPPPVQSIEPTVTTAPRPARPPAPEPREPAIVRPPTPVRPNVPAPAAAPARAPAPAASPAPARRAPIVAAPERIVERTVVVSASSKPLDDLAHAGRIVRFGIGQG